MVTTLLLLLLLLTPPPALSVVSVKIQTDVSISTTSNISFGCLALDWWPDSKCDYSWCPWVGSSFLNLDLSSPTLRSSISSLTGGSNIFLRLSGSLCDFVRYDFPTSHPDECRDFSDPTNATRVGYELGSGCLRTSRWDELNGFCDEIDGCKLIFGVNALYGRENATCEEGVNCHDDARENECCTKWSGHWDKSNAEALLEYTRDMGYELYGLEFGNELAGESGIQAQIDADTYSTDFCTFKNLVTSIWSTSSSPAPKVISPDNNYDSTWYGDFVRMTFEKCDGPDVVTWHQYILGAGVDEAAAEKSMDHNVLDQQIKNGNSILSTVTSNTPQDREVPEIWMGEAGGAYNSGRPGVTNAFMSSFWYLDGFGILSEKGHQTFCRQTLVGGNYGLLQPTSDPTFFTPNPDYFALSLWQSLMGKSVLNLDRSDGGEGEGDRDLRLYAHCAKDGNGVAVLVMNLANETSKEVSIEGMDGSTRRVDYVMTAADGIDGQKVNLNGNLIEMDGDSFPTLDGSEWEKSDDGGVGSLSIDAQSYGFFVFDGIPCAQQ